MPSFYNTPMQPTKPTVAAPPINEYREALYDEALPDDPAARMQEMKGRFDRLVRELGVSPRGPPRSRGMPLPRMRIRLPVWAPSAIFISALPPSIVGTWMVHPSAACTMDAGVRQ